MRGRSAPKLAGFCSAIAVRTNRAAELNFVAPIRCAAGLITATIVGCADQPGEQREIPYGDGSDDGAFDK